MERHLLVYQPSPKNPQQDGASAMGPCIVRGVNEVEPTEARADDSFARNFRLAFAQSDKEAESLLVALREELNQEVEPSKKARLHYEIAALLLRYRLESQATKELVQAWNLDARFRAPLETLIALFELKPSAKNLDKLYDALARSSTLADERRMADLRVLLLRDFNDDELQGRLLSLQDDEGPFEDIAAIFALHGLATGAPEAQHLALWSRTCVAEDLALTLALLASQLFRAQRDLGATTEILRVVRERFPRDQSAYGAASESTKLLRLLADAELIDDRVRANDQVRLRELLQEHQEVAPELLEFVQRSEDAPSRGESDLGAIATYVGTQKSYALELPVSSSSASQIAWEVLAEAGSAGATSERGDGEALALRLFFSGDSTPEARLRSDLTAAHVAKGAAHETFFVRTAWLSALLFDDGAATGELFFDQDLTAMLTTSPLAVGERVAFADVLLRLRGVERLPQVFTWLKASAADGASANALLRAQAAKNASWQELLERYEAYPSREDASHLAHFRAALLAGSLSKALVPAARFAHTELRRAAVTFLSEQEQKTPSSLPSGWQAQLESSWHASHDHDALTKALTSEVRGDVTRAAFAYRTLAHDGALAHELGGLFFLGLRDPKRARTLLERTTSTWARIALLPSDPQSAALAALAPDRAWSSVVDALWMRAAMRHPEVRAEFETRLQDRSLVPLARLLNNQPFDSDSALAGGDKYAAVASARAHLEQLAAAQGIAQLTALSAVPFDATTPDAQRGVELLLRGLSGDSESAYVESIGLAHAVAPFLQTQFLSIADDPGERADAIARWYTSLPETARAQVPWAPKALDRALLLADRGQEVDQDRARETSVVTERLVAKQKRDFAALLNANRKLLLQVSDSKLRVRLLVECAEICVDELATPDDALPFLEEALRLNPVDRGAFDVEHDVLADKGDFAGLLSRIESRIALLDDAQELAELFYEKARLLRASSRVVDAQDALSELFLLEEKHKGGLALLAELHVARGDWDAAANTLTQFSEIEDVPLDDRRMAFLGACDLLIAHDRSTAAFARLCQADFPLFGADAQARILVLARRLGDLDAVVRYAEKRWEWARSSLQGEPASSPRAAPHGSAAADRVPPTRRFPDGNSAASARAADAACFLAGVYLETGRLENAEQAYRDALRLDPTSQTAAEGLLALPRRS